MSGFLSLLQLAQSLKLNKASSIAQKLAEKWPPPPPISLFDLVLRGSRDFSSPTIEYADANGYKYDETALWWKRACINLPCFAALQWPDYDSTHLDDVIDGHPVVIQLWKGWCERFLGGLAGFPGGVGAEVGVYHRIPGKARPKSLPFLPPRLESFVLGAIAGVADNDLWWPFPSLNATVAFTLINPITKQIFFTAGPANTYWMCKWMTDESYAQYKRDQGEKMTPAFSTGYLLDYQINGKKYDPW